MTPKEKAKELVDKFIQYTPVEFEDRYRYAKQCALICVDEVIKEHYYESENKEQLMQISGEAYWEQAKQQARRVGYWQRVKLEIEKL